MLTSVLHFYFCDRFKTLWPRLHKYVFIENDMQRLCCIYKSFSYRFHIAFIRLQETGEDDRKR